MGSNEKKPDQIKKELSPVYLKSVRYTIEKVSTLLKKYNKTDRTYSPKITGLDEFIKKNKISGFDETKSRYLDNLQSYLQLLRPNLSLLIEYPYTDKLYRDAYYSYYSTLNRSVNRDCIRISIFDCQLTKFHFEDLTLIQELKKDNVFLGFFVLRPTDRRRIGRSFINPKALVNSDMIITLSQNYSLIRGVELKTSGFPHSSQDGKVHTCAETSIWSLMEYFGGKYSYYRQVLPSTILSVLKRVSFERQVPSKGLKPRQIGYTLRKFGFGSKYYIDANYTNLKNIINDYVESGIPVLAIVRTPKMLYHAILIIGHENIDSSKIKYNNKKAVTLNYKKGDKISKKIKITDSLDCVDKRFIVIDDNQPPYQINNLDKPCIYSSDKDMAGAVLQSCLVPLYTKIYLDVVKARQLVEFLIVDNIYGYKGEEKNLILRLFLTSSKSFKREILKNDEMPIIYRRNIVNYIMPKFVYLAELSTVDLYKKGKSIGMILLDATSTASDNFDNIVLFALYSDRFVIRIHDNEDPKAIVPINSEFKEKLKTFKLYENNLK